MPRKLNQKLVSWLQSKLFHDFLVGQVNVLVLDNHLGVEGVTPIDTTRRLNLNHMDIRNIIMVSHLKIIVVVAVPNKILIFKTFRRQTSSCVAPRTSRIGRSSEVRKIFAVLFWFFLFAVW